ncbi:MAG: hypothetical protein J5I92_03810 [Thiogranum sp.]|nr:hypothetical protein [Thiogranum sp.]
MTVRVKGFLYAICLGVAAGSAFASASNVQFSAQAVQTTPDRQSRNAQIHVGDNRVRLEYEQDGQPVIEIYDMANQRALLLVPQQNSYLERKLPPGGIMNPMLPPRDTSPCDQVPNAQCTRLGSDVIYERPVSKWEMLIVRDGQPVRSLHWIDEKRHMPLRQLWEDGTVSEMRPLGQETLHGRNTERWEVSVRPETGEAMLSTQWYDPELRIAIREELPGGYFRELRNIRVAPQPGNLFEVPAGYQQMTMPSQGAPDTAPQTSSEPAQQYPGR